MRRFVVMTIIALVFFSVFFWQNKAPDFEVGEKIKNNRYVSDFLDTIPKPALPLN